MFVIRIVSQNQKIVLVFIFVCLNKIVANFKTKDVERLLKDKGIVRHRGKIESVINNAQKFLELKKEFDSFSSYIWAWEPKKITHKSSNSVPASTEESIALSKDLKKRGWSFVGPTTMYAFMQSVAHSR